MKKRRKIDGIKFYQKEPLYIPENQTGTGFHCIDNQYLIDLVSINGIEVECGSVDIYEFERMLTASGKYTPFTDPDWINGLEYYPVRCYVEEETIVMVMRTPLLIWQEEQISYDAYRFKKKDIEEGIRKLRDISNEK